MENEMLEIFQQEDNEGRVTVFGVFDGSFVISTADEYGNETCKSLSSAEAKKLGNALLLYTNN
jgi:hypothetical protein